MIGIILACAGAEPANIEATPPAPSKPKSMPPARELAPNKEMPPTKEITPHALAIVYQGNMDGEIEPCG